VVGGQQDLFGDDEDFEIMDDGNHNEGDDKFDEIVGALQDILLDPAFEKMQKDFFNSNCLQFEATEENKLVYTSIFKSYTDLIEAFILDRLNQIIDGFDMETFLKQVIERKDEIDEPLMDLLLSFSEFESFKEMMLFARAHLVATTPKLKSGKAAALGLNDKV
jgi:ADP-ribosylation factor 2-binding protein